MADSHTQTVPSIEDETLACLARDLLPFLRRVNLLQADSRVDESTASRAGTQSVGTAPDFSPGLLLPTSATTLVAVQEQFLSIFGIPSVFNSERIPSRLTQPNRPDTGPFSRNPFPIPGNDFHAKPYITYDPTAWSSCLQLYPIYEGAEHSSPLFVPLNSLDRHPDLERLRVLDAAELISQLWPDNHVAPAKRRMLGPLFDDPKSVEYGIMSWLASKEVNGASVLLDVLPYHPSGYFLQSEERARILLPAVSLEPVQPFAEESLNPKSNAEQSQYAQIWSIATVTGTKPWIISFPLLAFIMTIMSNPYKHQNESSHQTSYVDQDMFWCLDSLQGFCRLQGLTVGERDLSFSLGTCPDPWMYFHFSLHSFFLDIGQHPGPSEEASDAIASGLCCERLNVTIPGIGRLEETRTLVSMRVATRYKTTSSMGEPCPSAVGFVMTDGGHLSTCTTETDWTERGLQSPVGASGVALFQTMIWNVLNRWECEWSRCLETLDECLEFQSGDLGDKYLLEAEIFDDESMSKTKKVLLVLRLLAKFRKHLSAPSQTIRKMQKEWKKTYEGTHSDRLERFDRPAQVAILENWVRVLEHSDHLHVDLLNRVRLMEEGCRIYQQGLTNATLLRHFSMTR